MALTGNMNSYLSNHPSAMHMWEWLDRRLGGEDPRDPLGILTIIEGESKDLELHRHLKIIKDGDHSSPEWQAAANHLMTHPELAAAWGGKGHQGHRVLSDHPKHKGSTPDQIAAYNRMIYAYGVNTGGSPKRGDADDARGRAGEHGEPKGDPTHLKKEAASLLAKHGDSVEPGHFIAAARKRLHSKAVSMHNWAKKNPHVFARGEGGDAGDDDAPPSDYGKGAARATAEKPNELLSLARKIAHPGAFYGASGGKRKKGETDEQYKARLSKKAGAAGGKEGREHLRQTIEKKLKDKHGDHYTFSHDDLDKLEAGEQRRGGARKGGSSKQGAHTPDPEEEKERQEFESGRRTKFRKLLGLEPEEDRAERGRENTKRRDAHAARAKELGVDPKKLNPLPHHRPVGRTKSLPTPELLSLTRPSKLAGRKRREGEGEHQRVARLSREYLDKQHPERGQETLEVGKKKKRIERTGLSPDESEEDYKKRHKARRAEIAAKLRKLRGSPPPKGEQEKQRKALAHLAGIEAGGDLPQRMTKPKFIQDVEAENERRKKRKLDPKPVPAEPEEELRKRGQLSRKALQTAAGAGKAPYSKYVKGPLTRAIRRQMGNWAITRGLPKGRTDKEIEQEKIARRSPGAGATREETPEKKAPKRTLLSPEEGMKRIRQDAAGAAARSRFQREKSYQDYKKEREERKKGEAVKRQREPEWEERDRQARDRRKQQDRERKGPMHLGDSISLHDKLFGDFGLTEGRRHSLWQRIQVV